MNKTDIHIKESIAFTTCDLNYTVKHIQSRVPHEFFTCMITIPMYMYKIPACTQFYQNNALSCLYHALLYLQLLYSSMLTVYSTL